MNPAELEWHGRVLTILSFMGLDVDGDVDLFEGGGLDSLTFVEFLMQLEEALNQPIPLQSLDLDQFRSVSSIARLLSRLDANQLAEVGKVGI